MLTYVFYAFFTYNDALLRTLGAYLLSSPIYASARAELTMGISACHTIGNLKLSQANVAGAEKTQLSPVTSSPTKCKCKGASL
jgi:hypothetical protein